MVTQKQVEQLATFDSAGHPVLSVYLNLEPERQVQRTYRVAFLDLVKQLEAKLDGPHQAALNRETERVRTYLESEPPRGKGLVCFSCIPQDLWQVYHLRLAVSDDVRFESTPYIRPLLDVLDEYERYAVVLVDKEKARLFTIYFGEIEEEHERFDVVPGKHKQGGWSQARYQRHHEEHVQAHLKRVMEQLAAYAQQRPFDRLILAGPDEAASELQRLLPEALRQRLAGTFTAEMFASDAEVLERAQQVAQEVERTSEEAIVEELLERAGPGGRTVVGIQPTLEAIWRSQVERAVFAEGAELSGGKCPACGRLAADTTLTCPACGANLSPVDDLVEQAAKQTLKQGGTVEIVHGRAAERLLKAGSGLAAFLRFTAEKQGPA